MKFVNVDRVLADSGVSRKEQEYLQAVNESLLKGIRLAETNYAHLPADEVKKARKADQKVIAERWQEQQRSARQTVVAALKNATEAYRSEKKIDVIIPIQNALSVSPALDASAEMAVWLKSAKLDFGSVPEITLKADVSAITPESKSKKQ